jgi:hypothetical protein
VADNIFTGLESVGGFYESISHIGFLLVFFFQERLFKSSFLRQLYQVDAEKIPSTLHVPAADEMVAEVENENTRVQESYLKYILDYMLLRSRLTYGYREIFHFMLNCKCLLQGKKHLKI